MSASNIRIVDGGGLYGSPAKQYLIMSTNTLVRPVADTLSDSHRSEIRVFLKFYYNGLESFSLPVWNSTDCHQVMVEGPRKSGSMDELTLSTKVVIKRGCSSILLKNRNTDS